MFIFHEENEDKKCDPSPSIALESFKTLTGPDFKNESHQSFLRVVQIVMKTDKTIIFFHILNSERTTYQSYNFLYEEFVVMICQKTFLISAIWLSKH